jgi:hypothetical protein
MVDPLSDQLLSARLLLGKIASSALFAGAEHAVHKARFARPQEMAPLLGRGAPAEEGSLLLGVGPYGRMLRVSPSETRRELGNVLVVARPGAAKAF